MPSPRKTNRKDQRKWNSCRDPSGVLGVLFACLRGSSEIAPRIAGAAQGCRVVCFLYNKPGLRCMVRSKQALVSHGKRGDPGHVRLALSWAARIEEQPLRTSSSSHHRILKQADLNHTRRGSGVNLGASHGVGQGCRGASTRPPHTLLTLWKSPVQSLSGKATGGAPLSHNPGHPSGVRSLLVIRSPPRSTTH